MEPNQERSGAIRVLRLFSRLNIGGPSIHVILLTAGLTAKGYTTRLVVGTEAAHEGNLLDLAEAKGVACEALASLGREIRPFQDLRSLLQLYRLMRAYRPQIVHTHAAKAGLLGRLAARLAGVPVVVHTYHGHVSARATSDPLKTEAFRSLERLLGRATDALIAVSAGVKQDLVELGVADGSTASGWWPSASSSRASPVRCPAAAFGVNAPFPTTRPSSGWWAGSCPSRTCPRSSTPRPR